MSKLDQTCDFKLITDYFGCLKIDRFKRTRAECELILKVGLIRWNGWIYAIDQERSVRAHPESKILPNYWVFITNSTTPVRRQCSAERFGNPGQGFNFCPECRSFWPVGEEHKHLTKQEFLELQR
jgi:hypothetical protein